MKTKYLKVYLEDLPKTSKTPILTYCRKLIKDGVDPSTKLLVFRKNNIDPDVTIHNIGLAAKLTVRETQHVGPVFVKYVEKVYPYAEKNQTPPAAEESGVS